MGACLCMCEIDRNMKPVKGAQDRKIWHTYLDSIYCQLHLQNIIKQYIKNGWTRSLNVRFSVATSLCMLCVFVCFPPSASLIMSDRSREVWTNENTQKTFCVTKSRLGETSLCVNDACNRSRRVTWLADRSLVGVLSLGSGVLMKSCPSSLSLCFHSCWLGSCATTDLTCYRYYIGEVFGGLGKGFARNKPLLACDGSRVRLFALRPRADWNKDTSSWWHNTRHKENELLVEVCFWDHGKDFNPSVWVHPSLSCPSVKCPQPFEVMDGGFGLSLSWLEVTFKLLLVSHPQE